MPPSLTTLPPELFSCVAANVESQSTLCHLARCSRQVYLSTIPHHRHVTILEHIGQAWQEEQQEEKRRQLHKFATLLVRRRDLAGFVRSFTLHIISPWMVKYNADKTLALLLSALPKVEKVVLYYFGAFQTPYLERMIQRSALIERPLDNLPSFRALTVVEHKPDGIVLWSVGFIASLLKLPAIQFISGGIGDLGNRWSHNFGEDKNLAELESSSSPLTSLNLSTFALSAADLGHILRAPKALKTFHYRVCPPAKLDFTEICHALGPQENCLESLGFHYDDVYELCFRHTDYEFFRSMTSFTRFKTLKVFKVPAIYLRNTDTRTGRECLMDIFPPKLETLHLTCLYEGSEGMLEAVEYLLSQKSPEQIPSLKGLILEENKWMPANLMDVLRRDTREPVIQRLNRVATAQGVSVDVIDANSNLIEYPWLR